MGISAKSAILAIIAAAWPASGFAQTTPIIIDQNRTDRRPPPNPVPNRALPKAPSVVEAQNIAPFMLTAVQISGATIPAEMLAAAAKPFIGQTVDGAALKKIADSLSETYADANIALYTIVVPQQDFAGGVVRLVVVEGYIEQVDLQGDVAGDLDLVKAYAARLTVEHPLSRATFRRYVSLIRDTPGLTPDFELLSGSKTGAVRLVIKLHRKNFQLDFNANNRGSTQLGRTQLIAAATLNDYFREGERTNLTLAFPTDPSRFQYVSLAQSEAIGTDGTVGQLSFGYLHTEPKGIALSGDAETLQLLVSHPLIRDFEENLNLSGDFDGIDSTNAVLGQTLANERVRALRASAFYSLAKTTNTFSLSATLSQGIDALGARETIPLNADLAFEKINLQAGYNQLLSESWVVRLRATGQYGGSRLPVSEFFNLGGQDYGRAFQTATVAGDQAFASSLEVAWHPPQFPISLLQGSELYGFFDGGKVWALARGASPGASADLTSAGAGIRAAIGDKTTIELEVARQLDKPAFLGTDRAWQLNFAIKSAN